jgi:hypothetical protein
MAILTASQDMLRYDPLKGGDLDSVDTLGKSAGKRVKTYDKELGYAVHPEEREGALAYKEGVAQETAAQKTALGEYETSFTEALEEADAQAQGILGQIEDVKQQETVDLQVLYHDGKTKTYKLNKEWVDRNLAKDFPESEFEIKDGVYTVRGDVGDEHTRAPNFGMLRTIAQVLNQTRDIDTQLAGYQEQVEDVRAGATAEIASQRGIAEGTHAQNIAQAERNIEETGKLWTNYVAKQQQAFKDGAENNTGGIRDLLDSGALVVSGRVS